MSAADWEVESHNRNEKIVKRIRVLVSSLMATAGIFILFSQLYPLGQSYLKNIILQHKGKTIYSPVPGAYKRLIGDQFAYWDPGESYFQNLITQSGAVAAKPNQYYNPETKQYENIIIDSSYAKPMELTIPSLQIKDINVQSNVASYSEDVYNQVLKNGLAHFQGTPLPDAGGNTFIYGHSAVQSFFEGNKNNPEIVFTQLENIQIGDEVIIEKDGVEYRYVVRKKKIVEPDDFSILEQQKNKETVTLMTCSPAGIATHRLIVIAERI